MASGKLIVAGEQGDGSHLEILIPGTQVKHRCVCGAKFFDTGDAYADDQRFLRHEARCTEAAETVEREIFVRSNEPLSQTDSEQIAFLKAEAERQGDFSVKGTSRWPEWIRWMRRTGRRG